MMDKNTPDETISSFCPNCLHERDLLIMQSSRGKYRYSDKQEYLETPHNLLNENDVLTNSAQTNFNGYLVDENYFAGCDGGGGSSSSVNISNGTNNGDMLVWYNNDWVSLPIGSDGSILTIQNGLPLWVDNSLIGSSLNGGVIGYIFQPGDSGFVYGEQHGIIININARGIFVFFKRSIFRR